MAAASPASARYGEMEFRGVGKVFGVGDRARVVLDDCSFVVSRGKLNVLIGPSGCGKTTIVNLLAGYERPSGGDVRLDGEPVRGPSSTRLVVFQETALFPWMRVLDNVAFGPLVRRAMDRRALRREALRLLEQVGLKDFAHRYPIELSGGMQRRAELARAMINDPRVMLMDEPFRGLDAMTRQLMQEYYLRLFEESRRTSLFVTSELEEAIFLADRLIILTNRPSRVKKVMDVDLPRPRTYQALASPRYLALKEEALDALHEEAVRAFATGTSGAYDLVEAYRRRTPTV
jgi:NitT/TauT family transport system ATP-binding protein